MTKRPLTPFLSVSPGVTGCTEQDEIGRIVIVRFAPRSNMRHFQRSLLPVDGASVATLSVYPI
jgi:hypothetical protein